MQYLKQTHGMSPLFFLCLAKEKPPDYFDLNPIARLMAALLPAGTRHDALRMVATPLLFAMRIQVIPADLQGGEASFSYVGSRMEGVRIFV
ncbi:hypothetical protein FEF65_08785 [Mariprofundus erugo]|uniref:Uncharacterized protein n=1 Tax=Mariprofundus erugo TaxID=2528639 RepID=A0A5R9GRJ0_9PROT|nr:hypothetical protein [Mariprofundus erugo]TLS67033.1 hypothetical protein FEF65_08785 [Mariprofundus erugo]